MIAVVGLLVGAWCFEWWGLREVWGAIYGLAVGATMQDYLMNANDSDLEDRIEALELAREDDE